MKKNIKKSSMILIISLFLMLSISFVSANWFTDLFKIGDDSNLRGQLASLTGDNLVAYYPLDGNAQDASGNGNNGIVIGNASYTTGVDGSAIRLDGVNGYIDLGNNPSLKPDLPVTLSAWVYSNEGGLTNQDIIALDDHTTTYNGIWMMVQKNGKFGIAIGDGGGPAPNNRRNVEGTTSLRNSTWYHVVAVIKEQTSGGAVNADLYVNGVKESVLPTSYAGTGGDLVYSNANATIGKKNYFNGKIDDVRIYNTALSDSDVLELYQEMMNQSISSRDIEIPTNITANQTTCTDSDGGLNYYVKGLVTTSDESVWDLCYNNVLLSEGTCDEAGGKAYNYTCPGECLDGRCVQNITANQTITCYNDLDCGTPTQTTYCYNDSICTSGSTPRCNNPGTTSSYCSLTGGQSCSYCEFGCSEIPQPACIELTQEPCTLTNAYWSATDVDEGTPVQMIVEGTNCEANAITYEIWEDDLFGNDYFFTFLGPFDRINWVAEYSPDFSDDEYFFIARAQGSNPISSGIMKVRDINLVASCGDEICSGASDEISINNAQIIDVPFKGITYRISAIVTGTNEVEFTVNNKLTGKLTKGSSAELFNGELIYVTDINYQFYQGGHSGSATIFLGENERSCVVDCGLNQTTCTDSDGGLNYYVKGYVNTSVSLGTHFEDYCLPNYSNQLIERHCLSDNPYNFTVQYNCPNNCSNGACINQTA